MSAHTSGPWSVRKPDSPLHVLISANGDDYNGSRNGGVYVARATGPEAIPNAHLIAAAPDFYSAASKLIAAFDELRSATVAERIITGRSDADIRKSSEEAISELRAALAKARGDA